MTTKESVDLLEEVYRVTDSVENVLRGISLDPGIPDHAREVILHNMSRLSGVNEAILRHIEE